MILLSDCLLYTYYVGAWVDDNTSLRVGYTILIGDLQVRGPPPDHPYPTEFFMTSSVRSFIVRAKSIGERDDWIEALSSAQEDHFEKLGTFNLDPNKPSERTKRASLDLGEAAPVWIPDERVTHCQSCDAAFSLIVRRPQSGSRMRESHTASPAMLPLV